ncbi:hypothetical protein [Streptomyces hirsutus]|uniref:hypothetical protein n=1 Tax=Streptomyces hirsutus TaxID=35620 RepID=UPI0036CF3D86
MEIRITEPSRLFAVTRSGAGLSFEHPCTHGAPALSLHLFSEQGETTEDIGVLLPTCVAPDLFGAALAFVKAGLGADAADQFVTDMLAACDEATERIDARRAEHKAVHDACCEAGFRTGGSEHTCRPSTDTPA